MKYSAMIMLCTAVLLAGCGAPKKNYDDMAQCDNLGYKPGTKEYDTCLDDARKDRMLQQQQKELEQLQQQRRDDQNMRF